MWSFFRACIVGALLAMIVVMCVAQAVKARHARVELLSQTSGVEPGRQSWLGVHFSLEKGWHIYWRNPGDSGQPPVFQWQLPAGFSAGQVQWPRPDKMKTSTLADYGYHDDTLLLVPIHTPGNLKNDEKIEIGLRAKWLICREVCLSDHAELHIFLPVATAATENKNTVSFFAEAKKLVPKSWPPSWKATVIAGKEDFVLSIRTGKPVDQAEFFPFEPDQIENAAPQTLQKMAQGAKITLKKSDQLLKPVAILKGVLVMGDDSYEIHAPVTNR